MKIEWLYEAQREYLDLLHYYRVNSGADYARRFSEKILGAVENLTHFPEMGVLRKDTTLGKYGFRVLFIGKYACVYRIAEDTVLIYHLADARTNYIYNIFGIEG